MALERIALGADSVEIELTARELTWLVDGRYRLEARIIGTDPEETRCVVRLVESSIAGRFAGKALALLPDGWVNPLLTRWLPGVRREGSEVIVSHRALARAFMRAGR